MTDVLFQGASRVVVIKIGSSVCATERGLRAVFFRSLAADIAAVQKKMHVRVVIVSSGAIAAGIRELGLKSRPKRIELKTAAAAAGQAKLMAAYSQAFAPHGLRVAQVLITASDLEDRGRYRNVKQTLDTLLEHDVIPIVNENDTVSVEEILYGDNDLLSASIANFVGARLLIILSHLSGIKGEKVIFRKVRDLKKLVPYVRSEKSRLGSGGIDSKLKAIERCARFGIATIVARGSRRGIVSAILSGREIGTRIELAKGEHSGSRRFWIAYGARPKGILTVDAGAETALRERRASLLFRGISSFSGRFEKDDVVSVVNPSATEFARGIVSFGSKELRAMIGRSAPEAARALGFNPKPEVIHRDDLVLL